MWPAPAGEPKDTFLQAVSSRLFRLRKLSSSSPAFARGIADVHTMLDRRKDFLRDHELWTELYRNSVMAYPRRTRLAGLPFVNVTKHNHVVTFYMRLAAPAGVPLVHFDSHSDLSPIRDSGAFVRAAAAGNATSAQAACWDIGSAMTGVLLLPGPPRPMVWVTPSWVPDTEGCVKYWKHTTSGGKVVLAHCDPALDKPLTAARLYRRPQVCAGPSGSVTTVCPDRGQARTKFARLLQAVPPGPFLLDIDLDYFVCNGRSLDLDKYMRTGYDLRSHGRAQLREFNEIPRDLHWKHTRQFYDLNRTVRKEVGLVLRRLASFERLLRELRAAGRVPCAVSVCDSTGVLFTPCTSCASSTNGYMPVYYAAMVNQRVLAALHRVYGGL